MIIKEVLNNNNKDNSSEGHFISSKAARFVALVLVIATLISTLTVIGVNGAKSSIPEILGAKGTQFTENSYIAGKLQELFELLPYSDYPYFTTYGNKSCGNSSCSYCNGYNVSRYHPTLKTVGLVDAYDSWSCFAFATQPFSSSTEMRCSSSPGSLYARQPLLPTTVRSVKICCGSGICKRSP